MTPDEIRAEFAKIRKRYESICDAVAPIAVHKLTALETYVSELETALAQPRACFVCGQRADFDLIAHVTAPSRSNPLAAAFGVHAAKGGL